MGLWPTQGDENGSWKRNPSPLSSRPERTRISYFALLATNTCAALCKESRMQIIKATALHRKSGGAQWRDLRFSGPFVGMFFDRAKRPAVSSRSEQTLQPFQAPSIFLR
jgi:hypothetical protein